MDNSSVMLSLLNLPVSDATIVIDISSPELWEQQLVASADDPCPPQPCTVICAAILFITLRSLSVFPLHILLDMKCKS